MLVFSWLSASNFLIFEFTTGFGPCQLSRVMLSLEMTMALGSTEPECLAVVPNKHDSMSWIDRTGAKVAPFNPHQQSIIILNNKIMEKICFIKKKLSKLSNCLKKKTFITKTRRFSEFLENTK